MIIIMLLKLPSNGVTCIFMLSLHLLVIMNKRLISDLIFA